MKEGCKMKKTWKKCLVVLVSLCLIFCVTGVSAFAEETDAAKIGETPYATLDEAIANAADGDVIVLLKDCTTEGINLSKNLTIQGSGNETPLQSTALLFGARRLPSRTAKS